MLGEDGGILKKLKPYKRKKRVKRTKKIVWDYKCSNCKDTGLVVVRKLKVKCGCVVRREINSWLTTPLRLTKKRALGLDLGSLAKSVPMDTNTFIKITDLKTPMLLKHILKTLIRAYYLRGMETFTYSLITGNDYTERYVEGTHLRFHKSEFLVLMLGRDNHNKTLETTIHSLLMDRDLKGLKTWVVISKEGVSVSDYLNLYGRNLVDYLEDTTNFDYLLQGNRILKIKSSKIKKGEG